ncbi:hypothetical protein [Anoxybacillus sp. KU2-6(11)]|uniref:hypothetical protein n=1 Tax=Anoxybacillus sp. KU2-6(11) TaxID=1535751 RepID=UPI00068F4942|nr:hypothetical protein [Anoxybacillus sp. KU2-6(11)]
MRYKIGLDIGITSVGWAIINLDENRIEDLGVRILIKLSKRMANLFPYHDESHALHEEDYAEENID